MPAKKKKASDYKISPWTKREIAMLGKYPDEEVARRLGRSVHAVMNRRQKLKINRGNGKWFTEEEEEWLLKHGMEGKMRDEELAAKLGRSLVTIHTWRAKLLIPCPLAKRRLWTDEELELLGKFPDEEVAAKLSRDPQRVRMKRLEMQRSKEKRHTWTEQELAMIGKMSDLDVAEKTGQSISSVRGQRHRMGIRPFGGKR